MIDLSQALKVAKQAAQKAGLYQKQRFLQKHNIHVKTGNNLAINDITIKEDKESEKIILDILAKNFPRHKIYSEEKGWLGNKESDYLWTVDPLDGTSNFALNVPVFCTQMALTYKKIPLISVIYLPVVNSLMWAIKDKGTFQDNKRVFVSANKKLKESIIALERGTEKKHFSWFGKVVCDLLPYVRKFKNYTCSGYVSFLTATGSFDAVVDYGSKPYDFIPGLLAIKEAGGKVTDKNNQPWNFNSQFVVASNGKVHEQLLQVLNKNNE